MLFLFKRLALLGDVWVLWVLLAASVLSLGVAVERWLLFRRSRVDFPAFMGRLRGLLEKGEFTGGRHWARSIPALEARVALAGLDHFSLGAASVTEAMEAQMVLERSLLERRLVFLATLGNNAPFIGLFGTVLGIIKAFNDLGAAGQAGVSVVMAGISSALIATAFGILVALPAVMANNYFQTAIRRRLANAQGLAHTVRIFAESRRAAAAPAPDFSTVP